MLKGRVKWFDHKKGYGFIIPESSGPDVFVHATELRSAQLEGLEEGEIVGYETMHKNGRTRACNIKTYE